MNRSGEMSAVRLLWTSLRTTPVFDLLRGRLTGSLDLGGAIAAAALPEPLDHLTRRVARRTRLWRIEQVEVARELTEHFRDGLAAGRSADELIQSFGELRQASRLIRRAKLRARPLFWRVWRRVLQAFGAMAALAVGCYLFLAIRLFVTHPTLAHNYGLELVAPTQGVPEADRAWPFYREAMLRLTPVPLVVDTSNLQPGENSTGAGGDAAADNSEPDAGSIGPREAVDVQAERPGSENWKAVERWLDENRDVIETVRQGAARPRFGFVYNDPGNDAWMALVHIDPKSMDPTENKLLVAFLLPQMNEIRRLGNLLEADARRALSAGDRKVFVSDVAAIIGMAEQLRNDLALLVVDLISYSIFDRALVLVDEALTGHASVLDDADLAHLAHRVSSYADGGPIIPRLTGVRTFVPDFVQRICSDDGRGGGVLTYEGVKYLESFPRELGETTSEPVFAKSLLAPLAGAILSRREMIERANALVDRTEAEFQRPLWQWPSDDCEAELQRLAKNPVNHIRYAPLLFFMPGLNGCYAAGQRLTLRRDATLVALALTLYHRRHGAWPERLEELVPDLLPVVPPDRFTGQPLHYRVVDGRPLIYAVGPDLKDNGGQGPDASPERLEQIYYSSIRPGTKPTESDIGWDWVLWRPEPESAAAGSE